MRKPSTTSALAPGDEAVPRSRARHRLSQLHRQPDLNGLLSLRPP